MTLAQISVGWGKVMQIIMMVNWISTIRATQSMSNSERAPTNTGSREIRGSPAKAGYTRHPETSPCVDRAPLSHAPLGVARKITRLNQQKVERKLCSLRRNWN